MANCSHVVNREIRSKFEKNNKVKLKPRGELESNLQQIRRQGFRGNLKAIQQQIRGKLAAT